MQSKNMVMNKKGIASKSRDNNDCVHTWAKRFG